MTTWNSLSKITIIALFWLDFYYHRTMIGSILISQIVDHFYFREKRIITPESIDTPSDISLTWSSYWIPPRIYICLSQILLTPDIMPAILYTPIEPCSLKWMESYFSIILLRTSKIDRMMSTIDITSPDDRISTLSKRIHILRKFTIEYEFPLPRHFRFSTIWEINTE